MGATRDVSGLGDVMARSSDGMVDCCRCAGGRSCVTAGEVNCRLELKRPAQILTKVEEQRRKLLVESGSKCEAQMGEGGGRELRSKH
jgi:hypothetical protein